jgi:hypothetical protein
MKNGGKCTGHRRGDHRGEEDLEKDKNYDISLQEDLWEEIGDNGNPKRSGSSGVWALDY